MRKQTDESISVANGFSRVTSEKSGIDGATWLDGEVITKHGIVTVYAQGDDGYDNHSRLDFVWNGRMYMRNFPGTRFSKPGLTRKAKQFAAEIVRDSAQPTASPANKQKETR